MIPSQTLVYDVAASDFPSRVIERSREVPILVDFWAPWCGPCRVLGPLLEKIVTELDGAVELAKIDTEQNPEIAVEFRIQGIPAVKLFRDGAVVDEFVGALPEQQIREFLTPWCPSELDELVREANSHLNDGDLDAADRRIEAALALDSGHSGALLSAARINLARGHYQAAQTQIDGIPMGSPEHEKAQAIHRVLQLAHGASQVGAIGDCHARIEADAADVEAHWALGAHHAAAGRYRDALEEFLRAVEIDRKWNGEAARKAMLAVFDLVGAREPLAEEFRDHLRRILY